MDSSNATDAQALRLCAELDQADARIVALQEVIHDLEAQLDDRARMSGLGLMLAMLYGYALGIISMAVWWWMR